MIRHDVDDPREEVKHGWTDSAFCCPGSLVVSAEVLRSLLLMKPSGCCQLLSNQTLIIDRLLNSAVAEQLNHRPVWTQNQSIRLSLHFNQHLSSGLYGNVTLHSPWALYGLLLVHSDKIRQIRCFKCFISHFIKTEPLLVRLEFLSGDTYVCSSSKMVAQVKNGNLLKLKVKAVP